MVLFAHICHFCIGTAVSVMLVLRHMLGGTIVLGWDNVSVHLRVFTDAQAGSAGPSSCPPTPPDLNPVESRRCSIAACSPTSPPPALATLVQVIRRGLKEIQYQPRLIKGCLAGTVPDSEPD